MADAMAQAHRQGVYHRDLKPGNIMLTKSGSQTRRVQAALFQRFARDKTWQAPTLVLGRIWEAKRQFSMKRP